MNIERSQQSMRGTYRSGDPHTSRRAANSVSTKVLSDIQRMVNLLLVRNGPLTDERLIRLYREAQERGNSNIPHATDSSIRTRRKELVEMGFARAEGEGVSASGRSATLWGSTRSRGN